MADTGKIIAIVKALGVDNERLVHEEATEWLDEHITNPDSPPLDRSLSSSSSAAPADMVGSIKSALNTSDTFVANRWYTGNTIGSAITETTTGSTQSLRKNVTEGEIYRITCEGGSNGRAYYLLDKSMNIVSMADANANLKDYEIIIPSGVVVMVVQTNTVSKWTVKLIESETIRNIVNGFGCNGIIWESGGFDAYGRESANSKRIRSKTILVPDGEMILVKTEQGYAWNVVCYDKSMQYIDMLSSYISNDVYCLQLFQGTVYFRVLVKRTDDGNISAAEGSNITIFARGLDIDSAKRSYELNMTEKTDWISGRLSDTGKYSSNSKRIMSPYYFTMITDRVKYACDDGYAINYAVYDEINTDGDLNGSWLTGAGTIAPNHKYIRFMIKKTDESDITTSAADHVSIGFIDSEMINVGGNDFYGKRISFLGDSITTFAGDNPETAPDGHKIADGTYTYLGNHCRYPQNNLLTNVNNCYWKILIDSLDMVLGVNESWAGSKVSYGGQYVDADDNADVCISSQTRINHLGDNGTPDVILVNAGTNDIIQSATVGTFNTDSPASYTDEQIAALSVATFADAYRAMLIRLLKTYPGAEIVCMLPNFTSASYYSPKKADTYLEIIKEACDYFGVKWIDARAFGVSIYNLSTYLGDGVHPNAAGMSKYANDLIKKFRYDVAL